MNIYTTPRTDAEASDGWSGDAVCVSAEFARGLEIEIQALKALPPNFTYWGDHGTECLNTVSFDLILFKGDQWDFTGWCNNHGGYPAAVRRETQLHVEWFGASH